MHISEFGRLFGQLEGQSPAHRGPVGGKCTRATFPSRMPHLDAAAARIEKMRSVARRMSRKKGRSTHVAPEHHACAHGRAPPTTRGARHARPPAACRHQMHQGRAAPTEFLSLPPSVRPSPEAPPIRPVRSRQWGRFGLDLRGRCEAELGSTLDHFGADAQSIGGRSGGRILVGWWPIWDRCVVFDPREAVHHVCLFHILKVCLALGWHALHLVPSS